MIHGRLERGRPVIDAQVFSVRLGVFGPVAFLVDTGCDFSAVHPSDAANLGVDYAADFREVAQKRVSGVGGQAVEFDEPFRLIFEHTNGDVDEISITIGVAVPTSSNLHLPSLLGRDVLRFYRLTFQESANLVILQRPDEL